MRPISTKTKITSLAVVLLVLASAALALFSSRLTQTTAPAQDLASRPIMISTSQATPRPAIEGLIKRAKFIRTDISKSETVSLTLSRQGSETQHIISGLNYFSCVPSIYNDEDIQMSIETFDKQPFELEFGSHIFPTEYFIHFDDISKFYQSEIDDVLFVLRQNPEDMDQINKFMFLGCPEGVIAVNQRNQE